MKKLALFSFLFLIILQINVNAQTAIRVNGDFDKGTVMINDVSFTKNSTIDDYEKVLGKAERIVKVAGQERLFAYDSLGISLSLIEDTNIVQSLAITYIPDSSKRFAKGTFKGTLLINGKEINTQTNHEQIAQEAKIDLIMAIKGMYMGEGKALKLVVNYPEATIGQFGFSF